MSRWAPTLFSCGYPIHACPFAACYPSVQIDTHIPAAGPKATRLHLTQAGGGQAFEASGCDDADYWNELLGDSSGSTSFADDVHEAMEEAHLEACHELGMGETLIVGEDDDPGAVKVGEAVCYFMELRDAQAWSRPSFDRFLKVTIFLLGGPKRCRLPESLQRMRTVIGAKHHMEFAVHVCVNWCRHFPPAGPRQSWDKDEVCGKVLEVDTEGNTLRACMQKRFEVVKDENGRENLRPKDWFYYFGLRNIIRRWLGDPEFGELRARSDARTGEDFWTSAYAKSINAHPSIRGALFQEILVATGASGVKYYERHTMAIHPGADDCQVWNSDVG